MNRWLTHLLGGARTLALMPPRAPRAESGEEDQAATGCGWFDSSHELRHGLWVQEHASADAVANDLPLDDWLQLHLASGPALPRP